MAGMQATVYGRLGKPAKAIATRTDTPMAIGSVAVDTSHEKNPDSTTWMALVCFGRNAEMLLACSPGEMVSAIGRVQVNKWQAESGTAVEQLQLVVDALHSPRTVRAKPKGRPGLKVPAGSWPELAHRAG